MTKQPLPEQKNYWKIATLTFVIIIVLVLLFIARADVVRNGPRVPNSTSYVDLATNKGYMIFNMTNSNESQLYAEATAILNRLHAEQGVR